jgi:hypothetical protein
MSQGKNPFLSVQAACEKVSRSLTIEVSGGEQRICVMEDELEQARVFIASEMERLKGGAASSSDEREIYFADKEKDPISMFRLLDMGAELVLNARNADRVEKAVSLISVCSGLSSAAKVFALAYRESVLEIERIASAFSRPAEHRVANPMRRRNYS